MTALDSRANALDAELPSQQANLLELLYSPDWTFVKEKDGVTFRERKVAVSDVKASHFVVHIPNVGAEQCCAFFADITSQKEYDKLLKDKVMVKKVDDDSQVIHFKYDSVFPGVDPRDFVAHARFRYALPRRLQEVYSLVPKGSESDPNSLVLIHAALDASKDVPTEKGYVRAVGYGFGWIMQQLPDGSTMLHKAMCFDPMGHVPTTVVNMTLDKQMKEMSKIRAAIQKRYATTAAATKKE